MGLSLKTRVVISFIIANIIVFVLGFTVFHFLSRLHNEINNISIQTNQYNSLVAEIRFQTLKIIKDQNLILLGKSTKQTLEDLTSLCDAFLTEHQYPEKLFIDKGTQDIVKQLKDNAHSLKDSLGRIREEDLKKNSTQLHMLVAEYSDKFLEIFSEFQDAESAESMARHKLITEQIRIIKTNMMFTLIITFVGTMLLGLVVPGKIALPFKKIHDAIRELQDCNFDVSIYYNGDDEIGEMAKEMNKMILGLKRFEELRADRIVIEGRKFDTLANMVNKHILVINAKGEVIYMNNDLYSLLQCQSDDILHKEITDTLIPEEMTEALSLALKRRSKIENVEILLPPMTSSEEEGKQLQGFTGYATVIPIRAKESSSDYYLMIMSEDLLV